MKIYKYDIGQIVNGLEITGQTTKLRNATFNGNQSKMLIKSYTYRCLKCGYSCGEYYRNGVHFDSYSVAECGLISGNGCFICSKNGAVAPNINSITATSPNIMKFIVNDIDALQYTDHSGAVIDCKCPDCGKTYRRKIFKIAEYGVPCTCGDSFSYPEKFFFSMLSQLRVEFDTQYRINCSTYRYDFYIKDINAIVEVNGIQHYKVKWKSRNEPENDIKKKDYAYSNGFDDDTYIVIDCRESDMEHIERAIASSKFVKYFDISVIDFEKCAEFASSNLAKVASEYWNKGLNVQEISNTMHIHKHTVIKYLKQGNDANWCTYSSGDGFARRVENRSTSGVIGVSFHKNLNKWCVTICYDGKKHHICTCDNINDAICERLRAEIEYFGYDNAPQKHLFDKYSITI